MFSLCSVPCTCLQTAISSSAKTARPRRGALNFTYWRPVLRLPGSRRALGLAKQGLKSRCKLAFRSKSRQREHGSAAAHDVVVFLTRGLTLCHIAYNINMTRGLTLCQISLHKSFHCAAASATRPHRTTFVEPRQSADFRSRVARRVRLVSRGSCNTGSQ